MLGPFWGLMIFNLNRFVVLSMRLEQSASTNFIIALPRFLIAFIVALVIMTPLELRLFSSEINEIIAQEREECHRSRSQDDASTVDTELQNLEQQLKLEKSTLEKMNSDQDPRTFGLKQQVTQIKEERDGYAELHREIEQRLREKQQERADEKAGRNGRPAGIGPEYKKLDSLVIKYRKSAGRTLEVDCRYRQAFTQTQRQKKCTF